MRGGRRPSASALVVTLAWLLAGGLALVVGVRAGGVERGTVLALLVGALPLTLLPAYVLLPVALALRRRLLSLLSLALVAAHLAVIWPTLGAADLPPGTPDDARLRVVTANLYVRNPTPVLAGRSLRALRPDVLVVPELSPSGLSGLRTSGLLIDLPYSVVELGERGETVGLFSRTPLSRVSTRAVAGRRLPRSSIQVAGRPVQLLAVHPLPPLSLYQSAWRASLRDLAAEARALNGPAVVVGDFNADRDHAPFRALLDTGLRDAHDERGRGLARTWPADFPLLQLDHVLVRDGDGVRVSVRDVREISVPGSDHKAVLADLAVTARS